VRRDRVSCFAKRKSTMAGTMKETRNAYYVEEGYW